MKNHEIKVKVKNYNYSILIGKNTLNILPKKIKLLCPKTKNVALIIDKNVPKKFKKALKNKLKNYNLLILAFSPSEKNKSLSKINYFLKILLSKNFNRSDLIIGVGGGITGDVVGFVASIFKRGINFINIPTTLLAQVDSAIGGKTGVNSSFGKNLIGSFYQPRLVVSDISFINSLSKKELICGYAEILKHSIIKDSQFFEKLKKNTDKILKNPNSDIMRDIIAKSCKIKLFFVNQDEKEKNQRMILNFGHTFAHGIEAANKFSSKINHGEAVLIGMMLAIKLSLKKKICSYKTLVDVVNIYEKNDLNYKFNKFFKKNSYKRMINFMINDKKNIDKKISLILLKKIGVTTKPGSFRLNASELKKILPYII